MRVLAVDPGETTGWALWTDDESDAGEDDLVLGNGWVTWGEEGPARGSHEENEVAKGLIVALVDEDVIVVEDFILRPTGNARRSGLSPVRITARLEALAFSFDLDLTWVYQQASAAKGVVTDERLKGLGLWVRGAPHARDAIRHLVLYLRSAKIPIG